MNRIENYRKYFTKKYLMGPNSFRLLDELVERRPEEVKFGRTLDLGCGYALTSLFMANETDAGTVYALDLWISASENYERIRQNGLEDKVIPIHGDAMDMPFAYDYFDSVVSVDSYHYFGCKEGVFADRILPFIKKDGYAMIAIPGLKKEPEGEMAELFREWAEGDDAETFHTAAWWENLLKKECGDRCGIVVREAECSDEAWNDWYATGHEFALRDKEYLDRGLYELINFVLIYVKRIL